MRVCGKAGGNGDRTGRDALLLRKVGEIMDRGSRRHCVGNFPHHRREHRLWRRHRQNARARIAKTTALLRAALIAAAPVACCVKVRHGRPSLQCVVPVHRKFSPLDHGRSDLEQARRREISRAFSAGSQPKGSVHPETLRLLQSLGYDTSRFRSKSWSEFADPGAPLLDFVFTVCDNAAGETCPVWPGQPMTAHWGIPDPAEAKGSAAEIALAFKDAYRMLNQRIGIFNALPMRSLDQLSLQQKLREIGRHGRRHGKDAGGDMKSSLAQRTAAEGLGTAFLLAAVVGSGIMAAKLAGGNGALALLCNTLPTGAILTVLILTLGPISGAHFNPAVSWRRHCVAKCRQARPPFTSAPR